MNVKKIIIGIAVIIALGIGFLAIILSEGSYIKYVPQHENTITCKGTAECITGQVTRVIDGDTVIVNNIHVRFALASAPELTDKGGIEAKNFIESLCLVGSKALVDEDDGQTGGSYGRTVAELYCNNKLVNSALLENNLGTIDKRFCGVSEFSNEDWAKKYGC